MWFFKSPVALLGTTLVGMTIIAVVVYNYTRETTSADLKYSQRPGIEIDTIYNHPLMDNSIAGLTYYSDDNVPESAGGPPKMIGYQYSEAAGADTDLDGLTTDQEKIYGTSTLDSDTDNDGLPDGEEISLGTNPTDNDTDKDGVTDGAEVALGTDPSDPDSGGTDFPIPSVEPGQPGGPIQQDRLFVNTFYKNVKNLSQSDAEWSHSTEVKFGGDVAFLIYMELTNPSLDQKFPFTIKDNLGKDLQYISNSGYIRINNGESELLPDTWLIGYERMINPELNPQKPVPVEITFNALAKPDPLYDLSRTINQAILQVVDSYQTDTVFIKLIK